MTSHFAFQLAKLSPDDMNAVNNMRYLGGLDGKKTSGSGFSLKFDSQKVNNNDLPRFSSFS